MWSVVEFSLEKDIAVIPNCWLINKKSCKWPNFKNCEKIMSYVKKAKDLEPDWEIFEISRIFKSFGTFNEARAKLKTAEIESDLSEGGSNSKRKLEDLNDTSSSDESQANLSIVQTPKRGRPPLPPLPLLNPKRIENVSLRVANTLAKTNCETKEVGSQTDSDQIEIDLQAFIKTNFDMVKSYLWVLQESVDNIHVGHGKTEDVAAIESGFNNLPLNSIDDIELLTEYLKKDPKNQAQLVKCLVSGGTDTGKTTLRVLRKLMTDNLAKEFNWLGSRGSKKSFSTSGLYQLVIAAVKMNPKVKGSSEDVIEKTTKDWLNNSTKRIAPKKVVPKESVQTNQGERDQNDSTEDALKNVEEANQE